MSSEFNETIITIAAVCVSLIGNTVNAVGYVLEKKAHNTLQRENASLPFDEQKSYTRDCLWISGFLTFALGSLLHAGALAFGPQSLLTPVTSVTLVANTFLAHKYLGEPLRKQDILGTILIVAGCCMAIIFGPRASDRGETTANDLLLGFVRPSFAIFFTVLTLMIFIDYIAVKIIENKNSKLHKNAMDIIKKSFAQLPMTPIQSQNNNSNEGNININNTNINTNDEKEYKDNNNNNNINETKNENTEHQYRIYKGRTFLMLSLTSIAGYWGSSTQLFTKGFGELMVALFTSSWEGAVQLLISPGTYAIIVLFLLANVLMEYWKQRALGLFGALYVIPIYQVEMIVGGTLFGAMFFGEFEDMSTLYLFLFFVAIVIDVIGVSILASSTGIKEHVKVYNIVRKQLLVMKAMKAFLSLGGIQSTNNEFIQQIMNDADTEKDAMLNLINREAQKLQEFKDPELLLNVGTGAKDLHAMQALNEVEAIQYQYTIGGILAPVFYNKHKRKHIGSPPPPIPYSDTKYKKGYQSPPMQQYMDDDNLSVSSIDQNNNNNNNNNNNHIEDDEYKDDCELYANKNEKQHNGMIKVPTYSSNNAQTPSKSSILKPDIFNDDKKSQ